MRTRVTFLLSLAAAAALAAQAPQDRGEPVFRSGANYVRVDMYATRDGEAVQDLQASELEVLENGVPQKVEDFEHVVVRQPGGVPANPRGPESLRASREAAADPRSRVFVIFLDTYHTQSEGSTIMRKPLAAFLDRVLGPDDLVALMTPEMAGSDIALGNKTKVIQDVVSTEWWGRRARVANQDPKELLYEECLLDIEREIKLRPDPLLREVIGRRREKLTLDALEDVMTHLGGLRDERKAVVLVTEGWVLYQPNPELPNQVAVRMGGPALRAFEPPVRPPSERGESTPSRRQECQRDAQTLATLDNETLFRTITDDANRGNVTFYPVYARGLASFDAPIGPDYPPPIHIDMATMRTRHDHLRTLAVETDGEAIINTNYIEAGLKRIADDLSSYYLFGYYSTNTKLDGKYRTITVRVKRPGVRVRARRGYRARTAAEVAAAADATVSADTVRPDVLNALGAIVASNSRSTFRIRPAAWVPPQAATGAAVWVVGELEFRTRREPAWANGARADVVILAADGRRVGSADVEIPAGQGAFSVRVPIAGSLAPGDYAVRVRLRGQDADVSDTTSVIIPEAGSAVGEAVMWRRGTSTGTQYVRTSDPRFQRGERLRLELPSDAAGAMAKLLDRAGNVMQVPVQVSERSEAAEGIRWIVADVTLAPLAPGDYAVEVAAGGDVRVTGFRVIP